jgi:plastocyanin
VNLPDRGAPVLRQPRTPPVLLRLFAKVFGHCVNMRSSLESKEGVFLKRSVYIATLSAMIVLAFAAIALAQGTAQQSSSDPISTGTDPAQSPTPSQQVATPSEQPTSDESAPTVGISNGTFDPAQVEVASGIPVTFVNEDTVAHTLSLEGLFDTSEIPAGSSYPVTLEGTGTVTYNDEANPEMQGTITLGGAVQGEASTPEGSADDTSQVAGESTG